MKWEPIETYDKLKKKPERAVFYVKEKLPINTYHQYARLPETVSFERYFGSREVTHWLKLPPLPAE